MNMPGQRNLPNQIILFWMRPAAYPIHSNGCLGVYAARRGRAILIRGLIRCRAFYQEIRDNLGEAAFHSPPSHASTLQKVKLLRASIDCLPAALPCFDCIVCISTFEHMLRKAQQETLKNFARHLKPDGLIIITVDYPCRNSASALRDGSEGSLVPVGSVEMEKPPKGALYLPPNCLCIFIDAA